MKLLAMLSSALVIGAALCSVSGCGASDGPPILVQGAAQGACFPNDTCNAGLVCKSKVCVAASSADSGSDSSSTTFNDAGQPCPGVAINHPGNNETRGAGTQVPFIGLARDATCAPITDGSLVWDDNGTQIGTGGNFSYSFKTPGTRTITLTATDQASNKYKASITLIVN